MGLAKSRKIAVGSLIVAVVLFLSPYYATVAVGYAQFVAIVAGFIGLVNAERAFGRETSSALRKAALAGVIALAAFLLSNVAALSVRWVTLILATAAFIAYFDGKLRLSTKKAAYALLLMISALPPLIGVAARAAFERIFGMGSFLPMALFALVCLSAYGFAMALWYGMDEFPTDETWTDR